MIAGLMKMSAVAETSFVDKTRKPASVAARPTAARKRAPAKAAVALASRATGSACAPPRTAADSCSQGLVVLVTASVGAALFNAVSSPQAAPRPPSPPRRATSLAGTHDGRCTGSARWLHASSS